MAVFAVHWCRVTRWLLLWSLKQPTPPLSGILYEKRPVTARSRSAVWSYSEVDYWIGDSLGSPTFKLWESKRLTHKIYRCTTVQSVYCTMYNVHVHCTHTTYWHCTVYCLVAMNFTIHLRVLLFNSIKTNFIPCWTNPSARIIIEAMIRSTVHFIPALNIL